MKKIANIAILISCLLLISCHSGNKKKAMNKDSVEINVATETIAFPVSEVLNLKSYYLSVAYSNDSLRLIYGYNYKTHSLDCMNLSTLQISQINFMEEGAGAVMRPLNGVYVHNPDSIWVYDASQRALLVNSDGVVSEILNLRNGLGDSEVILVNSNYAMNTAGLYYDQERHSLLYGVKDLSTTPVSFRICETFLDGSTPAKNYSLKPSVVIPDVANGDYANMSEVNINFGREKIVYNYPAESHLYILDRHSLHTEVVEADSHFTRNEAFKCSSKDYAQWERHGIENPHFYDVMYLPAVDMYARLHVGEKEFDTTKDLSELINGRDLYLMFFDKNFLKIGETKLLSCRYSFFTGWCAVDDGVLLYIDNALDDNNAVESLQADIVKIK